VTEAIWAIIAAIMVAAIASGLTRVFTWGRQRHHLSHLYAFFKHAKTIQLIVPQFHTPEFVVDDDGTTAMIPPNVPVMPMAEGGSIVQLVGALHSIGCRNVRLVDQEHYHDEGHGTVTISVGGPSVNRVSARLLSQNAPDFHLSYPEHVATYGTTTFTPKRGGDNSLEDDYGFIAIGTTPKRGKCLVLLGVWAPGTQAATEAFLNVGHGSEADKLIKADRNFFAVAPVEVNGLEQSSARITNLYRSRR
jgi:hypothetical protein